MSNTIADFDDPSEFLRKVAAEITNVMDAVIDSDRGIRSDAELRAIGEQRVRATLSRLTQHRYQESSDPYDFHPGHW